MAFLTLAFLAALASSLVSGGPVSLDNATLFANGQQAQILNSEFEFLQVNDSCNSTRSHPSWPLCRQPANHGNGQPARQPASPKPSQSVSTTRGRHSHVLRRNHASHFLKSGPMALYVCFFLYPTAASHRNVSIWVVCCLHKPEKCCLNNFRYWCPGWNYE